MAMDDKEQQTAFMSALVTEHFVLQTAASATVNEAGARTSLYVLSVSSSLLAMGFLSRSADMFLAFACGVSLSWRQALFAWRQAVLSGGKRLMRRV